MSVKSQIRLLNVRLLSVVLVHKVIASLTGRHLLTGRRTSPLNALDHALALREPALIPARHKVASSRP